MVEADAVVDHGLDRGVVLAVLLVQVDGLVPEESSLARAQHLFCWQGQRSKSVRTGQEKKTPRLVLANKPYTPEYSHRWCLPTK